MNLAERLENSNFIRNPQMKNEKRQAEKKGFGKMKMDILSVFVFHCVTSES